MKITKEQIDELRNILFQTCIDFISKNEIEDVEAIEFNTEDFWQSDVNSDANSYLVVKGIDWSDVKMQDGGVIQIPYYINIGESFN